MQVAVFGTASYPTPEGRPAYWPVPPGRFDRQRGQQTLAGVLDLAACADELGFDWITCAEHHYSPFAMSPTPMVLAAAIAQVARRPRIAVLGPTIPMLNPVRVAEEFAVLDNLTGGRVIAGLMRGSAYEYNTYSINPAESRERFEEGLELIRAAWTEPQPFGWEGRYYRFRSVSLWPQPVQQPHPPIFMSGSSRESGEVAARNRVNIGMAATTVPLAAASAQNYREAAVRAGWTPVPENILFRTHGCVADTDAEARQMAEYFLDARQRLDAVSARVIAASGYYGADVQTQSTRGDRPLSVQERIDLGYLFCGTPDTVFQQLCRSQAAIGNGVLELGFQTNRLPHKQAMQSLELFGREVLPRLQELRVESPEARVVSRAS
jgi:alkanesulfonate monooxygenase SsuD/methylene tetrahydromethanopterin reductase-like flavin-dependent oxidoreductase (luciferase family)